MAPSQFRSLSGLLVALTAALLLAAALPPDKYHSRGGRSDAPVIKPGSTSSGEVELRMDVPPGTRVRYTLDGTDPGPFSTLYEGPFTLDGHTHADRLVVVPTSLQWRHPVGDLPHGVLVKARCSWSDGSAGPVVTRTVLPASHGQLPVFALSVDEDDFFGEERGIYVTGNAIFGLDKQALLDPPHDHKWWKYPGNFNWRGKGSERRAHLDYFAPGSPIDADPIWSAETGVRINGNNSRGFPQHALRLILDEPLNRPLFGPEHGTGHRRLLLRTAGNDMDHAFFRDALQHRLCEGLPFSTSACVQSVLYINGAYWGLHNLRERMDAKELARRYGLKAKEITIIEDRMVLYDGDERQLKVFSWLLGKAEQWDARNPAFVDSLERRMDVDGFLCYMAAQIILANTDWPEQNLKWWRWTGTPDTLGGPGDGRWRFIMTDSDLGMGLTVPPNYDMFAHIDRHAAVPVVRLLKACLRSTLLKDRFARILDELLAGPLSADRMTAEVERMRDAISLEMPVHIGRWRRPGSVEEWNDHVEELLTFAAQRPAAVKARSAIWLARYPLRP